MDEKEKKLILEGEQLEGLCRKLAWEIYNRYGDRSDLALIGIYSRGAILAQRIKAELGNLLHTELPLGFLDINLYRDDLSTRHDQPEIRSTDIHFDISGKNIILIDDVIYTGRTARAALDALIDFGRPASIILSVLVDRGWREYPIQPDVVGIKLKTARSEIIDLHLTEKDQETALWLITR